MYSYTISPLGFPSALIHGADLPCSISDMHASVAGEYPDRIVAILIPARSTTRFDKIWNREDLEDREGVISFEVFPVFSFL